MAKNVEFVGAVHVHAYSPSHDAFVDIGPHAVLITEGRGPSGVDCKVISEAQLRAMTSDKGTTERNRRLERRKAREKFNYESRDVRALAIANTQLKKFLESGEQLPLFKIKRAFVDEKGQANLSLGERVSRKAGEALLDYDEEGPSIPAIELYKKGLEMCVKDQESRVLPREGKTPVISVADYLKDAKNREHGKPWGKLLVTTPVLEHSGV